MYNKGIRRIGEDLKINGNILMLTIVSFLLLAILMINNISRVYAGSEAEYDKSYISIEIQEGDTLSSIAEQYAISPAKYKDYIDEVKYTNNLKSDMIHADCYLLVPVYNEKE